MKAINEKEKAAYQAYKIKRMIDEIIMRLQLDSDEISDPHFAELVHDSNQVLYDLSEAYYRFEKEIAQF